MAIPSFECKPGVVVLVDLRGEPQRPDWAADFEEATIVSADPGALNAMVSFTQGGRSIFGPVPLGRLRPAMT
jgi:hypothetical protein